MPRMKAKWVYGTPEWEEAYKRLDVAHPEGLCWYCAGLLDYDGDWGAYTPTEAEIDAHFAGESADSPMRLGQEKERPNAR